MNELEVALAVAVYGLLCVILGVGLAAFVVFVERRTWPRWPRRPGYPSAPSFRALKGFSAGHRRSIIDVVRGGGSGSCRTPP